ncbi:TerB family tellurite resistance protein [Vibrio sp.]|uniref:tellurite resistance TerB family protein n=1 Tax=Vibrio sp. TaxID=678 RepID=UPI003D142C2E
MLTKITSLFQQIFDENKIHSAKSDNPDLAIACLLSEVAGADYQIDDTEREVKTSLLAKLTDITTDQAISLLEQAEQTLKHSASLYDFTSQLRALSQETRFELIKAMWDVAHADGVIDPLEDAVIRKTAELLYVDHSEFIRAKLQSSQQS